MEGRLVGTTPDYAEVTRLAVDRGRFLSDSDIDEERNYCVLAAEVAERVVSRRRAGRPGGHGRRRFLRSRRRDEAAGAVGRHRRLAGGREFFERRLHSDHDALAARRRHDRLDQARPVPARHQRSHADHDPGGRPRPGAADGRRRAQHDPIRPHDARLRASSCRSSCWSRPARRSSCSSCSWA